MKRKCPHCQKQLLKPQSVLRQRFARCQCCDEIVKQSSVFRIMVAIVAGLILYCIIFWNLNGIFSLLLIGLLFLMEFLIPYRKTDERPWDSLRLSDNVRFEVTSDVNENIRRFKAAQYAELQERVERAKSAF